MRMQQIGAGPRTGGDHAIYSYLADWLDLSPLAEYHKTSAMGALGLQSLGFSPDFDQPMPYMLRTRLYYAALGYTSVMSRSATPPASRTTLPPRRQPRWNSRCNCWNRPTRRVPPCKHCNVGGCKLETAKRVLAGRATTCDHPHREGDSP